MFKVLVDTCVWLDLAKDYTQQVILSVLEQLIREGEVELILPRTIVDEFERNKARIIESNAKSLSSTLKKAKEAIDKYGDQQKGLVISQLNAVDQKIPYLKEAVADSLMRIEKLFLRTQIIDISDSVKVRAAQRAIDKRAPFHRQRNGIDDAILIEIYADEVKVHNPNRNRFAFVTHNVHDFSHPNADKKIPHPDISDNFSRIKSLYFITLSDALHRINPVTINEQMNELEWIDEPRKASEIVEAIGELIDKVWYNRHKILEEKIEEGIVKIVEKETFPIIDHETRPVQRDIWEGALKAALEVEDRIGIDSLGPWDDFEWGMINGKLSALRWVLGDDWDMLDT
jgi:hypothetical protein